MHHQDWDNIVFNKKVGILYDKICIIFFEIKSFIVKILF
jgi:hypothetical protein